MTGRGTRQSRQRPPRRRLSRSDGRSQGRRTPTRAARAPLTACRRGGYPLFRSVLIQPATRVRFDGGNSRHYRGDPKWIAGSLQGLDLLRIAASLYFNILRENATLGMESLFLKKQDLYLDSGSVRTHSA